MEYTKGKWRIDRLSSFRYTIYPDGKDSSYTIAEVNSGVSSHTNIVPNEGKANAQLIAAAVNACIELNPDNPMAVAESISGLCEVSQMLMEHMTMPKGELGRPYLADVKRVCQKVLAKVRSK